MGEEVKNNRDPSLERADAFNELVAKNYELRVALNLIPVVGGALSELFGGRGSQILEERRDDFLRSLSEQMRDLENRAIKEGYFETEEGADVFGKAFEEALRTRSKAKRDLYARILRGAVLDYERKEYSAEEYLYLISDLTEQEVRVAFSVYKTGPGVDVDAWDEWGKDVCRELALDAADFSMILARIAALGLIEKVIGTRGTRRYIGSSEPGKGVYKATPAFAKFVRFLEQEHL